MSLCESLACKAQPDPRFLSCPFPPLPAAAAARGSSGQMPIAGSSVVVVQVQFVFCTAHPTSLPCPAIIPHPIPCRRAQKLVRLPRAGNAELPTFFARRAPQNYTSSHGFTRCPTVPARLAGGLPGSAQFSMKTRQRLVTRQLSRTKKESKSEAATTGATSVRQDKFSWPKSPRLDLTHTKIAPAMRPCRGRAVCRGRRGLAAGAHQPTIAYDRSISASRAPRHGATSPSPIPIPL